MGVLAWLQNSALATWVREANTVWAYPTVLFLHSLGMGMLVGINSAIDLRILGAGRRVPVAPLERFFPLMWLGFWINAFSGTALFTADAVQKAANPVFYVKLICIALAVLVIWLLKIRVFRDPNLDRHPLSTHAKVLAASSLVLWSGAITAGRLMAYYGNAQPL